MQVATSDRVQTSTLQVVTYEVARDGFPRSARFSDGASVAMPRHGFIHRKVMLVTFIYGFNFFHAGPQ
jgi:hypothetical protein